MAGRIRRPYEGCCHSFTAAGPDNVAYRNLKARNMLALLRGFAPAELP